MCFAFVGASRSGKTTLAREVAEKLGIEFHETKTSEVMAALGINIVGVLDPIQRIDAQEKLLAHHEGVIRDMTRPLMLDRSPLDMLAYTLAEVPMHGMDAELGERYRLYTLHCMRIVRQYYHTIIAVRPLPVYEPAPGKPPENAAYQWHIQYLIEGAMHASVGVNVATLTTDRHEERVALACGLIMEQMTEMAVDRVENHLYIH